MCVFAGPIGRVGQTQIFVRADRGRQLVIYEMSVELMGPTAMILPIPVAIGTSEHGVELVDLSSSPTFFDGCERAFGPEREATRGAGGRLAVQRVGSYVASYVPNLGAFDRIDPRFTLPRSVWAELPVDGFGFVVFELDSRAAEMRAFHPMAFWFPRRDMERLFFPTLHVHDGRAGTMAHFDHALYAQSSKRIEQWDRSPSSLRDFVAGKAYALVLPEPVRRRRVVGLQPNTDTWIPA